MRRPAVLLFVLACGVSAYPGYKDKLPNGDQVPHPCKANYIWHGVGHTNPLGGGVRNQFGKDFAAAGRSWTKDLCRKDSDGDGMTNGQELGDPECMWSPGNPPPRTVGITHPGVCNNQDGSACKTESWLTCKVEEGIKNCSAVNEPETRNMTVRFPPTAVPAQETSYMCMVFNLTQDQDYHLVAHEPYIDNANVMHHILLYGCDPTKEPIPDDQLNTVKQCGMGADQKCRIIIGLWAVGFPGYCLNAPAGFRFGAHGFKQAVIEFHWNNPQKVPDYTDSSGMTLFYTPKLRPNDAAILTTGQMNLLIPPGEKSVTVVGKCPSHCTKKLIQGSINVFWATNHMHYLGHEMDIIANRNGSFYTKITRDEIYNYDLPVEHSYSTAIQLKEGDEIITTCKFKSLSRQKTTFYGDATSDEMCFGFMAFYPASNMPGLKTCTSWNDISTCDQWMAQAYKGCNFTSFLWYNTAATQRVLKLVKDNCLPFGDCLKECKTLLDTLFKTEPCMMGDAYELVKKYALDYNVLTHLDLIARVDSCKSEFAGPNDGGDDNDDTNRASHAGALYSTLTLLLFTLYMM